MSCWRPEALRPQCSPPQGYHRRFLVSSQGRIQGQTHNTADKQPKWPSLLKQKYTLPVGRRGWVSSFTHSCWQGGECSLLGGGDFLEVRFPALSPLFGQGFPVMAPTHYQVFSRITLFECAIPSAWYILFFPLLVENSYIFCVSQITYSFLRLWTSVFPIVCPNNT